MNNYMRLFDQSVALSLRETGTLPEPWIHEYRSFVAAIHLRYGPGVMSIPREVFQGMHYVSTHLPLSYNVWKALSQHECLLTKSHLSQIIRTTEFFFWRSLEGIPKWDSAASRQLPAFNDAAVSLVELCFGLHSPIPASHNSRESFVAWNERFITSLHECSQIREQSEWPKWICIAIHFASFYLELVHRRAVDVTQVGVNGNTAEECQVIDGLRSTITNEEVLKLIALWLASVEVPRDNAGLPSVGTLLPRNNQSVSVRTECEVWLSC